MAKEYLVEGFEGSSALLWADCLRRFSQALEVFSDFNQFRCALAKALEDDEYLAATLLTSGDPSSKDEKSEAEKTFKMGNVVLPLGGFAEGNFIRVQGRCDTRPFDAGDMHLMGAIAGFVSLLTSKAHEFREQTRAAKVFQYLINQLPLGVVCCDVDGTLIAQSKLSIKMLGESGCSPLSAIALDNDRFRDGREQFHLNVDGKLLYAEGRRLKIEEGLSVTAFVIKDLSNYRYQLLGDIEREAFRSESRDKPFTLAILQSGGRALPGGLWHQLQSLADDMQIPRSAIQSLDAFRCACLFSGKTLRSSRHSLKAVADKCDHLREISLQQYSRGESDGSPADYLLESADQTMEAADQALLPRVLVFDPYPAISDALKVAADDVCRIYPVTSLEEAKSSIESGMHDGLFLGLDDCKPEALAVIHEAVRVCAEDIKMFYLSYKQPTMARAAAELDDCAIVFQKPFRIKELCESLNLNFN